MALDCRRIAIVRMVLEAVIVQDDDYSLEYKAGEGNWGYCHLKVPGENYWSSFSLRNDKHVAEVLIEILTDD